MTSKDSLESSLQRSADSSEKGSSTHVRETGILFLVLGLIYIPVFKGLFYAWNIKPEASHGYLILPISLYLVWKKRKIFGEYEPRGEWSGLFFIVIGLISYIFGEEARISTLSHFSLLFNIFGVLLLILGRQYIRELIFPIFFLVFMFPIPDAIYVTLTSPLKLLVSAVSCIILQNLGIAVIREGNIFNLANVTLEVVEACSGLRSLLSYLVLGTLLAYFLPPRTPIRKVMLVMLTLPVSLFVNILRIVITGILSNTYGRSAAEGFFHETSGVVLFLIGMCILVGVFSLMMMWSGEDKADVQRSTAG